MIAYTTHLRVNETFGLLNWGYPVVLLHPPDDPISHTNIVREDVGPAYTAVSSSVDVQS